MTHVKAVLAVVALVAASSLATTARASSLEDEAPLGSLLGARYEERDPRGAPLWFSIAVEARRTGDREAFGATFLLGLPLDRVPRRATFAEGALKPLVPRKPEAGDEKGEPTSKTSGAADTSGPVVLPVAVSPEVARGAVDAALRKAKLVDGDAKVDDMQSRARVSALLPELRVRVARRTDDGQNVVPTEYDPLRSTSSAVTTLLVEGRATWRLDRLAFAEDEVALERVRSERAEARLHLTTRILGELFAWQRARAALEEPNASSEERLAAALKILETEATLDVLTDGWFGRWRKSSASAPILDASRASPKSTPPPKDAKAAP